MVPHGRGRGLRKLPEDKPVGLVRSNLDQQPRSSKDSSSAQDDRFSEDGKGGEDSPIPPAFNTDDLLQLLESGTEPRKITRCIKHLCNSEQTLRQNVDEIHRMAKIDKTFGKNAAKAFSAVSQLEVVGVKFRDVVLRCIQTDFKHRADLKAEGEEKYLLAVNLLCEVFHNMRLADGTVINILSVPILEYFSQLLVEPTHEAIDLIVNQTHIIGEEVQRSKPEKFADFLLKIRKLVVEPESGLNLKDRCGLLHILESHLLRWPTVMPEKIGEFYAGILGEQILTRVNNFPTLPPSARPSSQESSQQEEDPTLHSYGSGGGRRIAHADPMPRMEARQGYARPSPTTQVAPTPRLFDTPPPNIIQNFPGGVPPTFPPRHNPPGMNGVERIAADMMAIHLPSSQTSPPLKPSGRSPGWQNMPTVMPPSGPPPNIPTAIVPPGVPPHNRPPVVYRESQGRPLVNQQAGWNNLPPNIPSANIPPSVLHGRDHFQTGGREMMSPGRDQLPRDPIFPGVGRDPIYCMTRDQNFPGPQPGFTSPEQFPKGREQFNMGREHVPMGREPIPMGRDMNYMNREQIPMGREQNPMAREHFMGREQNPMGQEPNFLAREHNPMGREHNPMSRDHNPMSRDHNPMGRENNPMGRDQNFMGRDPNYSGRDHNSMGRDQNQFRREPSYQGSRDARDGQYQGRSSGGREQFGGSGRIISGGVGGGNQWGRPEPNERIPPPSGQEPRQGGGGGAFVIDTWENPAAAEGGGGSDGGGSSGMGSGGDGGGTRSWSANDGTSSWGERDDSSGGKWSSAGTATDKSAANQWGSAGNDFPAAGQWNSGASESPAAVTGQWSSGNNDPPSTNQWSSGTNEPSPTPNQWSSGSNNPPPPVANQWSSGNVEAPSANQWSSGNVEPPYSNQWSSGNVEPSSSNQWSSGHIEPPSTNQWSSGNAEPPSTNQWSSGPNIPHPGKDIGVSHWGDTVTPEKDRRNDSVDSVSPAWKKEEVDMGNWADLVPSPRTDQDQDPLKQQAA